MSDEIDAIKRSDVTFQLTALQIPASKAARIARSLRFSANVSRTMILFPVFYFLLFAAMSLFFAWLFGMPSNGAVWIIFWIAILAALVWIPVFGRLATRRDVNTQPSFYLHTGVQALRQAAADRDDRLAPVVQSGTDESTAIQAGNPAVGRFQRLNAQSNGIVMLVMAAVLLALATVFLASDPTRTLGLDSTLHTVLLGLVVVILIESLWIVILALQLLRPFEITTDEQGVRWRQPTLGFGRRTVLAPWQDVRAFVRFRASKDGKAGSDMDEIFLLDAPTYAVAWKITPKTSPEMRVAHERFLHVSSEHVQLRDITASLKSLLKSPETRSYEYALAVLSAATPAHPDVRKALIPPERTSSRLLRAYTVIMAILLAVLVAVGLLLQFGIIPAGSL